MSTNTIDDEEIRILLMEDDPKTRQRALLDLCDRVAPALKSFLKERYFSLSDHDLQQAVNDTLIEVFKKNEDGSLDLECSLKSLLIKIACRRAADILRKLSGKRQLKVEYLEDVATALSSSGASFDWKTRVNCGEATSIVEQFRALIPLLPRAQRVVAEAMAESFPASLSLEELCDEVERFTGTRPTIAAAKDARQHVRKKFKELL